MMNAHENFADCRQILNITTRGAAGGGGGGGGGGDADDEGGVGAHHVGGKGRNGPGPRGGGDSADYVREVSWKPWIG